MKGQSSRISPLTTTLCLLATWTLHKLYNSGPGIDPKLEHVARQLDGFAARDQLAIELLPPGLVGLNALLGRLGLNSATLHTSCIVAEALDLVAVYLILAVLGRNRTWLLLAVVDSLIAISTLLTLDYYSVIGLWSACLVARVIWTFREVADTRKSLSAILSRFVLTVVASTTCQILFIVVSVSLCLGGSEVAYGGNYNLRYLDAASRRAMRPGFEMPTSLRDPGSGLHSLTPYSLYIPSAGFLWSDELYWNAEAGVFMDTDIHDNETPEEPGHRVIMKDPVGRFTPWLLQQDLGHSLNDGLEQELLLHKEPVVVRSASSKQFLKVLSGPSILEAQAGITNATDSGRFAVTTSTTHDVDTVFDVRDIGDDNFRLFHPKHGCYLATTFISFPDFRGLKLNDSMLHELHSELEVSCVRHASEQASTFHVIDGYHPQTDKVSTWSLDHHFLQPFVHHFKRGLSIITSMRRLHTFRTRYHFIQSTPLELLAKVDSHGAAQWSLDFSMASITLSILLPMLVLAIFALYKQRTNQSATFWSSPKGLRILVLVGILLVHRLGSGSVWTLEYMHCSRCMLLVLGAVCQFVA